jgi:hypothetical protein
MIAKKVDCEFIFLTICICCLFLGLSTLVDGGLNNSFYNGHRIRGQKFPGTERKQQEKIPKCMQKYTERVLIFYK